ncbi:MAG: hypothetical protein JWO03_598 [Bacteroidetes bacterium]|nr:hypothetical protein [Bacteroidota bacterium]
MIFQQYRYVEKIFEEIRFSEFHHLPSRYTCIYLADKINIELWHIKALQQLRIASLPIYEFKATGNIHYGDEEWLEVDIVSDEEYRNVARKYWEGQIYPGTTKDLREIYVNITCSFTTLNDRSLAMQGFWCSKSGPDGTRTRDLRRDRAAF